MKEQEAKDAAWSNSSTHGLPVREGTAYLLRKAFDEAWQLATEYRDAKILTIRTTDATIEQRLDELPTYSTFALFYAQAVKDLFDENQRLRTALEEYAVNPMRFCRGAQNCCCSTISKFASAALGGE